MSDTAGRGQTVRQLLRRWASFVRQVETGYDDTIYDYTNDLSVRDLLEEKLSFAAARGRRSPPRGAASVGRAVRGGHPALDPARGAGRQGPRAPLVVPCSPQAQRRARFGSSRRRRDPLTEARLASLDELINILRETLRQRLLRRDLINRFQELDRHGPRWLPSTSS
jgi:hypothetical protein